VSTLYIAHHGVDGQRWGQRNGPPYPLIRQGREKFSKFVKQRKANKALDNKKKLRKLKEDDPDTYENLKQKTLRSGSADDVLQFQGDLTNDELRNAVNRLDLEKRLKDISKSEKKKGFDFYKKFTNGAKLTKDMADAGKAMAQMMAAMNKLSKDEKKPKDKETETETGTGTKSKKKKEENEPMDGEWRPAFDPSEWLNNHPDEDSWEEPQGIGVNSRRRRKRR